MKARLSLLVAVTLVAACSKPADAPPIPATAAAAANAATAATPATADTSDAGIAWVHAASDAAVDAAFARAKAEGKPVFLYWGAKWCPPCNQVKATLFNRVDFIERSRAFVPVYVDGDSPGAQKLGSRFKVRGYPTMVLFDAGGAELTRLPGHTLDVWAVDFAPDGKTLVSAGQDAVRVWGAETGQPLAAFRGH
ncbi:MAG TPA: thioredoxin fold domain-containing protein, partial [Albitalea sp.]